MNSAQFAGHLGKDAVLRSTPSGQNVLNFNVAVGVGFGEKERTLWVTCALWGERAEKLQPWLTKGKAVSVAGDVDLRTYETKEGKFGAEMTLNVTRVTLQGGKKEDTQAPAPKVDAGPTVRQDFDDSIPF